jgi:hypothetical protein
MIPGTDLRIGNIVAVKRNLIKGMFEEGPVERKAKWEFIEVWSIVKEGINHSPGQGADYIELFEDLQPITMTTDLLAKVGFERTEHIGWWHFAHDNEMGLTISVNINTWHMTLNFRNQVIVLGRVIYLHKFQNLLHSLIGFQLKIKT